MDYAKVIADLQSTADAIERRYGIHPEAEAVKAGIAAIQELLRPPAPAPATKEAKVKA